MANVTWATTSEIGTTHIPLPIQNIAFLSPNQKRFAGYVTSVLTPMDKLLTPFRYVAVSESILNNDPSTAGSLVSDGSTLGLILRFGTLSATAAIAAFNAYLEYTEQEKEKAEAEKQLQDFRATLKKNGLGINTPLLKEELIGNIKAYNKFLKATYDENPTLQEKYDSIELEYPDNWAELDFEQVEGNIRLKFKAKSPKKSTSMIPESKKSLLEDPLQDPLAPTPAISEEKPLSRGKKVKNGLDKISNKLKPWYDAGNLISFAYWILWMSVGIMTGGHAAVGIAGLPAWAAILGPFSVIAFPIIGIHLYNYYEHGRGEGFATYWKNLELKKKAEADFNQVMYDATKKAEFEYWRRLNQQLSLEAKLEDAKSDADPEFKASEWVAGVSGGIEVVNSQVNFQYIAWFASDGLTALMGVVIGASAATPIGWALLGLSLVFGLVATGYRYIQSQEIQEKLAANNQMREPAPVIDREEYKKDIELKKKELLGLRDRLFFYEQMGYPMPASLNGPDLTLEYKKETFGQKLTNFGLGVRNHPLMDAWDWQMTGIFFTRIVIPTVSAALFWSITSVAVLASLSNPVTVALVFALGTVYTIAKWYEKKKQNAEKELIDLPKEKADLANQISLANLALQYNEKKCDLDMASKKSREKNNVVDISSSKNRLFSLPPATYAAKDNTSEVQENDLLGSPNLCYASS